MLDRMEMIGLKAGLRIDRFDRLGEAVRVICKRCGDMEPEVFSFLKKLPGLRTILRARFMGHQEAIRRILHHHHTVVRAPRRVASNMTRRGRGDGKQWLKQLLLAGQIRTNGINPSLDRRLGNGKKKERGKDQSNVPETDAAHHSTRAGQADNAVAHMLRCRDALDFRCTGHTLVLIIPIVSLG